jgi:hypothetical protein
LDSHPNILNELIDECEEEEKPLDPNEIKMEETKSSKPQKQQFVVKRQGGGFSYKVIKALK